MEVSTQNSTDKSLEKVSIGKPISVYTANFSKVIAKFPRTKSALKRKLPVAKPAAREDSFSKKVFSWRNVSAAAAILVIGVLHFALQVSFIRSEVTENRPPVEVPPVTVEQPAHAAVPVVETEEPAIVQPKRTIESSSPKQARVVRQRQTEFIAPPVKAQPRQREAVESRAVRLRRAERILTGV